MVTAMSLMKRDLALLPSSASVLEAACVMKDRRIGSVFVQQNERIVGIVTETDIVRRTLGSGQMPGFIPIAQIMTSPVIGIEGARPITEAADLMEKNHTRHLAVLHAGDIVGVLSVRDLLHPVSMMSSRR